MISVHLMNVGTGKGALILALNNRSLHGVGMAYPHQRSTTRSELRCGLLGVILDLLVLKQLAVISIAAILFTLYQRVGVFVDHDSYLESFELACQLHTLKQQVAEFVVEEALKEQQKQIDEEIALQRAEMLFNPDTEFTDRFEAVMVDLLNGKHVGQIDPEDSDLIGNPIDNEENPTNEF